MKKNSRSIVFTALLSVLSSCNSEAIKEDSLPQQNQEENTAVYTVNSTQFSTSEMEIAPLKEVAFHDFVRTTGSVEVPPENRVNIGTYFEGTLKQLKLLPGNSVKKGEVLFRLENPEYVAMQQEFLEAKSQLLALKSDYERQGRLLEDSVSSQKIYNKAQSNYNVVRVKYESLSKKLALMGINTQTLSTANMTTSIAVRAPIDGQITAVHVGSGSYLLPSQIAMTLVSHDQLLLKLSVFEKDLAKVQLGQDIIFTLQNGLQKNLHSTVGLINKSIDPEHRTLSIHSELLSKENMENVSPGMYVEAKIITYSESKMALPKRAVVDIDGSYFVLVLEKMENNSYQFRKQEVRIGSDDNEYVEIMNKEDFDSSSQVLVKGAFNLLSE